jgi:hypothetical protein
MWEIPWIMTLSMNFSNFSTMEWGDIYITTGTKVPTKCRGILWVSMYFGTVWSTTLQGSSHASIFLALTVVITG